MQGSEVEAAVQICEEGFKRRDRTFVHARRGERGRVVDVLDGGEWLMVQWSRTGTIAQCHSSEVVTLR